MAFFIGDRKKDGNYDDDPDEWGRLTPHPVVGLKNKRKVFDSDDAGGFDSDLMNLSMGSSRWKKKYLNASNPDKINRNQFKPYNLFTGSFNYFEENFEATDPSNFTISDNLNAFNAIRYTFYYNQYVYRTPQLGLANDSNDGRGSTWAIPLFHNSTYYTSSFGTPSDLYAIGSASRQGYRDRQVYGDSNNEKLVRGVNDFRPSSLIEPEQWSMRRLNTGTAGNSKRPFVFDNLRHKNIQYFQLLTNQPRDIEAKLFDDIGFYSSSSYSAFQKHPFRRVRNSINHSTGEYSSPENDPAFTNKYGKVLGYVLEPGRSIMADSDSNGASYLNWIHNDNMGKGKWAGMSVPYFTQIDSSRGLGIRRSYARKKPDGYLDTKTYIYGTSPTYITDIHETFKHMAYGASRRAEADPYVGMTMGSPCMLTYFGAYPTDNGTRLGDWSDVGNKEFPMVNALGKDYSLSKGSGDHWPRDNSRIWFQASYTNYGDEYILQDIIDSSAVNWSSGKGHAPMQERTESYSYPYVMVDYCPSRTNYNRKDENVLYDTQMTSFVETPTQDGYGGYVKVLDTKDAWRFSMDLEVSPRNFTTNDWNDSVATSNVKDIMVINNFDSDLIALHMVRDWDCWRR